MKKNRKMGWLANRNRYAMLCVAGAVLLIAAAFANREDGDMEQWIPLNEAVQVALNAAGGAEGGTKGKGGGAEDDEMIGGDKSRYEGIEVEKIDSKTSGDAGNADDGSKRDDADDTGNTNEDKDRDDADDTDDISDAKSAGGVDENDESSDDDKSNARKGSRDERGRLNINAATVEELLELKGIGPSKAKAIVEDREENGFFASVDELTRVTGIGEKVLAGIKESVVASP